MKISILIPHFRAGKITAYTIAQLLKFKGNHELDIIVIDNHSGDGSIDYLVPFIDDIRVEEYPKDKIQSHGIAFDYMLPFIDTDLFITLESDAFPIKDGWLDYYEDLINRGYDCGGSLLKLSGGTYIHPAGGIYRKSVWEECKRYCDNLGFNYFPNMSMKENHQMHLMIHDSILDEFTKNPEDYVELADGYKPYTPLKAIDKLEYYKPATGPFHSGLGGREESVRTYGLRTMETETPFALLNGKSRKLINRVGLEPGQFFSYWMNAMGKKLFYIPTEVKWLEGKENQQQEYTLNEAGVRHLWAVSAYHGVDRNDPVAKLKQRIPEELYETLPEHQKIKV